MICEKTIILNVHKGMPFKHYEDRGYVIKKQKDSRGRLRSIKNQTIEVKIEDLPRTCSYRFNVQCDDCGEVRESSMSNLTHKNSWFLRNKETPCLVCANKRNTGVNNSNYKHGNDRYCEYRKDAKARKIPFNLSVEQFERALNDNVCYYCGISKDEAIRCNSGHNKRIVRGLGLDRINSNKGYIVGNIRCACAQCNAIKHTLTEEDFYAYIERIYKRQQQRFQNNSKE